MHNITHIYIKSEKYFKIACTTHPYFMNFTDMQFYIASKV